MVNGRSTSDLIVDVRQSLQAHSSRPTVDGPYWSRWFVIAILIGQIIGGQATYGGEAFGGGVADVPDTPNVEQLSFHVREIGDETDDLATGQIKFFSKVDGRISFISHLEADCMRFLDENTALIGATVRNDSDPEFIGTTAIFAVRDNGSGAKALSDEFTGIFYALDNPDVDEWTCQVGVDVLEADPGLLDELLTPFGPGNLHVRSDAFVAAVPEPSSLLLVCLAIPALLRCRRR